MIHLYPKDILLTKGWEPTQRVIEPDAGNTGKYHLFPIMDFDAVSFPIVLMSGQRTLNILNIEEASMQPLLKIPTDARSGSSIAFILREDNGFSLHVARRHIDDENNTHHEWVRLLLRDDFITCLKEIGRLPPVTTRGIIEECKQVNKYKELLQKKATTPEGIIIQERLTALKAEHDEEKKVNAEQKVTIDDQQREIAELKSMLKKASGHKVMMANINSQKQITRDALSYVAEISREQNLYKTPQKRTIDQESSISIDAIDQGKSDNVSF